MRSQQKIAAHFTRVSAAFFGIGTILFLVSVILQYQGNALFSSFFLNLGISVFSVTIIEMIWRALGGGPLDKMLKRLSNVVPLLQTFKEIGINEFYADRDQVDFDEYMNQIESAKEIDMMAIALRANWTKNEEFMKIVSTQCKRKKCHYRVLVLDPESSVVARRSLEEGDEVGRIASTIKDSLKKLADVCEELNNSEKKLLEIKTVPELTMYCSIIRIDDTMFVTFYMSSHRGSSCPTIVIRGKTSTLFKKFMEEFEKLWELGVPYPAK